MVSGSILQRMLYSEIWFICAVIVRKVSTLAVRLMMPYTALRLYPLVPVKTRQMLVDTTLPVGGGQRGGDAKIQC